MRSLYVELRTISIRRPDSGGTLGDGKMVIDLKTGDVWGFPPIRFLGNEDAVAEPDESNANEWGLFYHVRC